MGDAEYYGRRGVEGLLEDAQALTTGALGTGPGQSQHRGGERSMGGTGVLPASEVSAGGCQLCDEGDGRRLS